MPLRAPFVLLAQSLQESFDSGDVSHNDLAKWLSDACHELAGPDEYCYMMDFIGDGESGDVVYCCNGDMWRAPYEVQHAGDKISVMIDDDNAIDVLPRTVYEEEADEDDHMAAMEESGLYAKGGAKLVERFISKSERKKATGASFAGKGRSFPILKAADVMAAVRSMGRAGSGNYDTATLKKNIIRIAKEKGFESELPKAWRDGGDSAKESKAISREGAGLRLVESASTVEAIVLREARADYEIKLIAPGKGSSAFYPAEVLKRDGPKVFGPGTHVYVNHPTQAEEAARPEGDVKNLAGVLTTAAAYHESHAKGPGLYARMKVFADHGQMVEEKAPHVGMSIRASGVAESGRRQDGVPVLKELTSAESVDVVTRAGAGGMILTESARPAETPIQEAAGMTADEVKKLVEAEMRAARLPADAEKEAYRLLETVSFKPESKRYIVETVLRGNIPAKDGLLDAEEFGKIVASEAGRFGRAAGSEGAKVFGMGVAAQVPVELKPEQIAAREAALKAEDEDCISIFESITGNRKVAEIAARGRVA